MINFTNAIKVSNVNLKNVQPIYEHQAWSGKKLQRATGIQYYEVEFTLTYNVKDRREVDSFLASYSLGKPFQMDLGHLSTYTGAQNTTVSSVSAVPAGNIVLNTNSQLLGVGDLVQFTNHTKLYRIIDRTNTSITVFPALRAAVQAGEIIKYNNLTLSAVLNADNDYTVPITNVMMIKLKATENL
ncbi:TPA: hypothetical protein IFB44_003210 [Escherichia coli]|uniref:hypothetical protein n=1 Tax=Escherichia coli TaxID=562 RepID=UPI0001FB7825|nr:hypothetical protein [Escherichia coli]EFC6276568.1 hypothetical protein [Escherichia coli]EFG1310027.1 hypothetical protein [Escherichia coli]EGB43425.1 hypothetical protein EREG_01055 [Escherichia coli H120]EJD5514901.1 hypothetical protein [Escherichia coli]EJF7063066.1 hypothetical protein [Escherichia coli]